jgi:hypothetical protein
MKKHIIWSYDYGSLEDWKEFIDEEIERGNLDEDCDEYEKIELVEEMNREYLDDEIENLNIPTEGKILAIASLGLWHGRVSAYKILDDNNINTILRHSTIEEIEWYCDGYNIKATAHHHDGTNYYEYRELREDRNYQNLLDRLYSNKPVSRKMINYYTKSIAPQVKAVYGWK